jgi:hypothetical protein
MISWWLTQKVLGEVIACTRHAGPAAGLVCFFSRLLRLSF